MLQFCIGTDYLAFTEKLAFCKSIRGVQASVTVYSIAETAMLNEQKPYNYFTYVMEKMKNLDPFPEKEAMLELLSYG